MNILADFMIQFTNDVLKQTEHALPQPVACGWYGSRLIHVEGCTCDDEYQREKEASL